MIVREMWSLRVSYSESEPLGVASTDEEKCAHILEIVGCTGTPVMLACWEEEGGAAATTYRTNAFSRRKGKGSSQYGQAKGGRSYI